MEWINFRDEEPPINENVFIKAGSIKAIGGIFDNWEVFTDRNGILTINGIPWYKFKITTADIFWLKESENLEKTSNP